MLANRCFQVLMGNDKSMQEKLSNGLPHGSILILILFSLYLEDIPDTAARKYGYADDWTLATRDRGIELTESIIMNDLAAIGQYLRRWRWT